MRLLALAALSSFAAGAAAADPLLGLWRKSPDDRGRTGLVEVTPCGAALCGTLLRVFDATGAEIASPEIGRLILWDTLPAGEGRYEGRIHALDRGQDYASVLVLSGDSLSVRGCVLGICREGSVWRRAD
jgi:uncharacterized protein (DUF2147 family)